MDKVRFKKIKSNFKDDHELKFYDFDKESSLKYLKKEIYQNTPFRGYEKTRGFLIISRVCVVMIIALSIVFVNKIISDKDRHTNVDDLFNAANIEYVPEPILVSSSYSGEELRVYQAYTKENGSNKVQYYYFYNQVGNAGVKNILFKNKDKEIVQTVEISKKFGNLSELVSITSLDNIEVIIVYNNNKTYSQFFVAKE